jgi:hypothetical protein
MPRNSSPAIQGSDQAVDSGLQRRRVGARVLGFSERLVDHRIERDDTPGELAPLIELVRQSRSRQRQHAGESLHELGR